MQTHGHPDQEALMAWKDGEVAGTEAAAIQAHVASCARCATTVEELDAVSARVRGWQVGPATFHAPAMPARPARWIGWTVAASVALALISLPAWWRTTSDRDATHGPLGLSANIFLPGAVKAAGLRSGAARVTLTVFVDWQCPACATSYSTYFNLMKEYEHSAPGQVALVLKDFPLDAKCNAAIRTAPHPAACEAAAAVRLARAQGRAEEMIQFLIDHVTPRLEPADVRAAATDLLGPFDFDAAYAKELPTIQQDVSEAVVRHVQFTPSFYINDVPLASNGHGLPTADELRAAIDAQLGNPSAGCADGMRRSRTGGCL